MWVRTELIDCPLCGNKGFDEIAVRADDLHIVKCKNCSLVFLNPRPVLEDIGKLYEQDYYSDRVCGEMSFKGLPASVVNVRYYKPYAFDILTEKVELNGRRTLDIGCSFGKWVYWMAKAGAKAVGIDLAEGCIKWGKKNLNLDLRQCAITDIDEPDNSFDVITMIDLIEHVAELGGFMKNLMKLLKPGGLVFVQTPNFESYYKYRQNWLFLHFGLEHILYFDTAVLDKLFMKYGMLPFGQTCVLDTIPCDKQGFIKQQRGLKRRLASFLLQLPPFCDFIHRDLSRLFASQYAYKYDTSRQSGAIIIGCYKKKSR
ncbi:MAG: methyltransferase domain-containing protein [Sedimentisphaerales bacterium]